MSDSLHSPLTHEQRAELKRLAEQILKGEWHIDSIHRLCAAIPILMNDIEALTTLQSCGHPVQCIAGGEDEPDEGGTRFCEMCRLEAEAMRAADYRTALRSLVEVAEGLAAKPPESLADYVPYSQFTTAGDHRKLSRTLTMATKVLEQLGRPNDG